MSAQIIMFVPRPNPKRELIGEYRADYSPLSPQQIAKPDPALDELYRNSIPYGGAGIDGMPYIAPEKDPA